MSEGGVEETALRLRKLSGYKGLWNVEVALSPVLMYNAMQTEVQCSSVQLSAV